VVAVAGVVALVTVLAVRLGTDDEGGAPPTTGSTTTTVTSTIGSTTTAPSTTAPTSTAPTTTAPSSTPAIVVRRGSTDRPEVALTFDAGSDTGYAAEILDLLAAKGVRATFGMTGKWAEANPALVRRMVTEGHQLVNHTYDHASFTGFSTGTAPLSRAQRTDELERAEQAMQAAAGVTARPWFRPPYGDEDASVRADVGAAGYRYELMWTVDSLGWKGVPAAEVTSRCLDGAVNGAIFLLHVGAASTDHTALPAIIDGLRSRGFAITTAAALVR
jgi:peptidoglycan/xylan/chitin deacetylase (PgdA/CDA1 family)